MDDQHRHQSHFESALTIYYARLKSAYLEAIKNAENKEYATEYYRTILFDANEAIPIKTVFFDELRTLFDHLYNLTGNMAAVRIADYLPAIREKSREALEQLERFCNGLGDLGFIQLPDHYEDQLDYDVDPREIIEQERQVLTMTDQQVIELLALYLTTQKLQVEFSPDPDVTEVEPKSESDRKDRFSRSQQVLVFHYLLEAAGVNYNSVSIADCARLLHKLIGVPTPIPKKRIMNSDLYKMLKKPTGKMNRKTMIDLRAILPYFENLPHYPIKDKINKHLSECNDDDECKDD